VTTKRALRPAAETPFREIPGVSREARAIQQAAKDATRASRRDQYSRGVAVTVALDGSSTQVVAHGLGRKPQAVNVTANPSAAVWTTGPRTTRTLSFTSSIAGTVEFWVY